MQKLLILLLFTSLSMPLPCSAAKAENQKSASTPASTEKWKIVAGVGAAVVVILIIYIGHRANAKSENPTQQTEVNGGGIGNPNQPTEDIAAADALRSIEEKKNEDITTQQVPESRGGITNPQQADNTIITQPSTNNGHIKNERITQQKKEEEERQKARAAEKEQQERERKEEEENKYYEKLKKKVGEIEEGAFVKSMTEATKAINKSGTLNPDSRPVVVAGATGVDKSTLITAILGPKSVAWKRKKIGFAGGNLLKYPVISVKKDEEESGGYAKIGHKNVSCTLYPTCYHSSTHNLDFCDLGGFSDRCEERRMAIAMGGKQLLMGATRVKAMLIMTSFDDLAEGGGFMLSNVLMGLTEMFEDLIAHADSIFFGLSKPDKAKFEVTDSLFRSYIDKLKDTIKKNNEPGSEKVCALLDYMLTEHQDHFLLVKPLDQVSRKAIITSLQKSPGFPSEEIKFIGDRELYDTATMFFDKCVYEGNAILEVCKTYPQKIAKKKVEINKLNKGVDNKKKAQMTEELKSMEAELLKNKEKLLTKRELFDTIVRTYPLLGLKTNSIIRFANAYNKQKQKK